MGAVTVPTPAEIERAAACLRRGGLVAFPTETVYGLGAHATNADGMERLYAAKDRPRSHPVIVHLAHAEQVDDWAVDVPLGARALAAACWPGPLTLVLRRSGRVPDAVTGGEDTVGLRVPDQPVAAALLAAFGDGVAAPSANRFGRVSPTTAAHVRADLGDHVDMVLDGGPCRVGVESTIVDCSTDRPRLLRTGAIGRDHVEAIVGRRVVASVAASDADADAPRAPGTLPRHYAPVAALEVTTRDRVAGHAASLRGAGRRVVVLDAPTDPQEYGRVLYARLREADAPDVDVIVAPLPDIADQVGVGAAIVDRLRRAAHP